jgi:filamentous hemagglutinin family protein
MLGGALVAAAPARADLPVRSELPVPCTSGCSAMGGHNGWISSGQASLASNGSTLYVNQQSDKAILNWQSFNISAGNKVQFNQPDAGSVALNRIYQADPSRIEGALSANGQVFLINRNGMLFGSGARVDVNSLTASTLNLSDATFNTGIHLVVNQGNPAFEAEGPMGSVVIDSGAELRSADGGRIMVLAPVIENSGKIETPGGQTILAASQDKVWLMAADEDDNLRGLLVEVGTGGDVSNLGKIVAKRGNITMMGFAVNQNGIVSATTTVNSNGSIKLLARDKGHLNSSDGLVLEAVSTDRDGEAARVAFGENSRTEVLPPEKIEYTPEQIQRLQHLKALTLQEFNDLTENELNELVVKLRPDMIGSSQIKTVKGLKKLIADERQDFIDATATAVDKQKQVLSQVDVVAKEIILHRDAEIVAPSGNVNLTATANPLSMARDGTERNDSRVILEDGSLIDVSGTISTLLPMSRNALQVELFSSELKDSPLQRNGVLYRKKVTVDIRKGTDIADISGELGKIEKEAGERLAEGGKVSVTSEGDFVMAPDATVDISGGVVNYKAGWMNTTKLVSEDKVYDISDADPNLIYDGVLGEYTRKDAKWGMTQTWTIDGPIAQGSYEDAYTEGASAGEFKVATSAMRMDGKVVAEVTHGKYQRDPGDQEHSPDLGLLELDLARLGGSGLRYDPATVKFGYAPAEAYDPEQPLDPSALVTIDPQLLQEGGIGRLVLKNNGAVDIPEGTVINLPAGGAFTISGSEISVDGDITVPAGTVSLTTIQTPNKDVVVRAITLGEHGRIDVSGGWINDYALTGNNGVDPLFVDGGAVTLNAKGDLTLASGSVIDADGGAYVDAKGKLHAGDGGDISLVSRERAIEETAMALEGELHAYAIGKGGKLTIEANSLRIAQSSSEVPGELLLTPEFFQSGGFNSYTLTANLDGITVEAGTVVQPQVSNLMLEGDYLLRTTGSDISEFSTAVLLPSDRRRPVDLNLNLNQRAALTYRPAHFAVETGATIELEPGARLALTSDHSIDINGVLSALAGEIALKVVKPADGAPDAYYISNQGIHLGADAQLLATATTKLTPNTLGQPLGEVLSGGQVNLVADRGHIVMESGSVIDVSGTAATLLVQEQGASGGSLQLIASDAGAIQLKAAEGMVLAGTLSGHAGGSGAAGGDLTVAIDAASTRGEPDLGTLFPFGQRMITLTSGESSTQLINGEAVINADSVEEGGFDSLTLRASDVLNQQDHKSWVRGQINLEQVDLELKRSVIIDAPLLNNIGGDSKITAAYVALADSGERDVVQPEENKEAGQLDVEAQHIDLIGNVTLQGWEQTRLASEGDIRLRGLIPDGTAEKWRGSLNSFGDLELKAAQIYPTTLTQFRVEVARPEGNLNIASNHDAAPSPVLSVGGKLTMKADNIHQAGVVKAPIGEIELVADTLVLENGSLTSTSADGEIIPFGRTESSGLDWVYPVTGNTKLVVGQNEPLPAQKLSLNASSVVQEQGATIDVSGGGDLYAYEFVEGLGGSRDVLAPSIHSEPNSTDTYAILPWLRGYGPYDPLEFSGVDLKPGDAIHLAAGSALPEGDYLLLPARYALLPGAYLVTKQAGTEDFGSALAATQTDGSVLVGGYRNVMGTDLREARWSGYTVAQGSIARTRSEYQNSFANEFFSQRAAVADQAAPLLPRDAGHVVINVGDELQLDGELRAQSETGRGARVDLVAENLAIVAEPVVADGTVQITADAINALGAESLLLGGQRIENGEEIVLTVSASTVTVIDGVNVDVPGLLLVARDEVRVDAGAVLKASGDLANTDVTYTVKGDGALLQLSAGAAVEVQRSDAPGTKGDLLIEAGAVLAGRSLYLDSSHGTLINGALNMSADDSTLTLGANNISFGDAPSDTAGLILTTDQLSGLQVDHLVLNSRETVDFYGDVDLNTNGLTLSAAGLVGHGTNANRVTIAADTFELKNSASSGASSDESSVADKSRLIVTANDLLLGEGVFKIDGFAATEISASHQTHVAGSADRYDNTTTNDVTLKVDGDLTLRTPVITAESGSDTAIAASGVLEVLAMAASQETTPAGLGARLSFEGDDVTFGSSIQLPSGDVRLKANAGDVHLLSGAAIDVSGRIEDFIEKKIATPAGAVTLHSDGGDVIVDAGANIALKSVGGADAGTLKVVAASGELMLDGGVDARDENGGGGGIVKLDLGSVADFSTLNRSLNEGGFGGKRELRQRHGDLVIAGSDSVNAKNIHFTADGGAIEVHGAIAAAAEKGGKVTLQASDDVHLHNTAHIDARATGADEAGGRVMLATTEGEIAIDAAVIDVSGTRSGENADLQYVSGKVGLRAPRVGDGVAVASLVGEIRGAESISVEAFKTYQFESDITLDSSLQSQILADTTDYMTHAEAIAATLNMTGDSRFHLRPGVEISSTGNLTVGEEWDFAARDYDGDGSPFWRFNGEPGVLTLQAEGELFFEQGVKDGIEVADTKIYPDDPWSDVLPAYGRLLEGDSWSFRFAGGADLDSADPLAVSEGAGKVRIGNGVQIHTGSGDIELSSGDELKFDDKGAAIFSAGQSGGYGSLSNEWMVYLFPGVYPVRGGDVSLNVIGDINGAGTNQLISDWLHRMGDFGDGGSIPTAWAVNFAEVFEGQPLFMQNLGAFGGGELSVDAGGDIDRLSAVAPTTGRPDGDYSGFIDNGFVTNEVTVLGGGDMNITAGGDIKGGVFYIDGGVGKIKAGKSLRADEKDLAPVLALGNARFEIQARDDLTLQTVLNPTVSLFSSLQNSDLNTYFITYGENSAVDLTSLAGDVILRNNTSALANAANFPTISLESSTPRLYPGDLGVAALQGNIFIDGDFKLFPSPHGDLSMFADGDITTHAPLGQGVSVNMSDTDPAMLPQISSAGISRLEDMQWRLQTSGDTSLIHAAVPVHSGDEQPVVIVARNGSLQGSSSGKTLAFYLPKQARLVAGKDIRDIIFSGQNLADTDLTTLKAGRDIVYTNIIGNDGRRQENLAGEVQLAGPGALALIAGRDIDLGEAKGVVTIGNTANSALADTGANITIAAGFSDEVDFAAYLAHYTSLDARLASDVAAVVRRTTGEQELSNDQALAVLDSLSWDVQRQLALAHFYSELTQAALEAAKGESVGYQRGYDAIAVLFGEGDYQGDIRLYSSRIYTTDGGDINMLAPGGLINAGLPVVKTSDKVQKNSDEESADSNKKQLGIVAQRTGDVNIYLDQDMLVNQSRVFALDGGDILIWSQHGDVDAGRGAKSALFSPPAKTTFDSKGNVITEFPPATSGSGIQTVASSEGVEPGGVTLAAPHGAVIANDAGINSAGRLTLAATEVLGADNISAGGESVGVPSIDPPSVSAEVGNAGNAAANAGEGDQDLAAAASSTPLSDSALAFLEVEVLGFGGSATGVAGAVPHSDITSSDGENQKAREDGKGNRLARENDDESPKAAEVEKPAGRVATNPAQ